MSIDKLNSIEEIKQLKAKYFRCLDTKNWAELEKCFTKDVTFTYKPLSIHITGSKNLLDNFYTRHAHTKTAHTGSMPEIEILEQSMAKGIWFMNDYVAARNNEGIEAVTHGFGHYFET